MGIELTCEHKTKADLTSGLGLVRHWYCRQCGKHWYKDREWTKKEWEAWIESDLTPEEWRIINDRFMEFL